MNTEPETLNSDELQILEYIQRYYPDMGPVEIQITGNIATVTGAEE